MRRRPALLTLLIQFLSMPLLGQGLPPAAPEEVGLSSERLARIRASYQQDVDRGELAGVVTLVARRGRIAHFEAVGEINREAGEPMRRDAIFAIASMTKPITSTAVMILLEEGRLLLDDPIARYIPAFETMRVMIPPPATESASTDESDESDEETPLATEPAARAITVRDLLRHTSGLTYDFLEPGPLGDLYRKAELWKEGQTLAEAVAKLAALPLAIQPGSAHKYGVSTDVLGYLVEVITGEPLDAFLEAHIFRPLKMDDTGFHVPQDKHDRIAVHYLVAADGLQPHPALWDLRRPLALLSGGAGLVSTATDYARFAQMLLGGGALDGVRILSRKTVELMVADHLGGLPGMPPSYSFGLGFALRTAVGHDLPGSIGNFSWGGIFNTFFWVDPEEELVAVFMTQISPFGHRQLRERFRVLVYQAFAD